MLPFNATHQILNPGNTLELERLLQNNNNRSSRDCLKSDNLSGRICKKSDKLSKNSDLVGFFIGIPENFVNLITLGKVLGFQYIIHQNQYVINSMGNHIPTIPGMSGAIALQTFLKEDGLGIVQRVGRSYNVNWGSERIFAPKDGLERISNLKTIISKII